MLCPRTSQLRVCVYHVHMMDDGEMVGGQCGFVDGVYRKGNGME